MSKPVVLRRRNMAKAFCLLNHQLTQNQIKELKEEFSVLEIVYPPEEISKLWSQIPATKTVDKSIINKITNWLLLAENQDVEAFEAHEFEEQSKDNLEKYKKEYTEFYNDVKQSSKYIKEDW